MSQDNLDRDFLETVRPFTDRVRRYYQSRRSATRQANWGEIAYVGAFTAGLGTLSGLLGLAAGYELVGDAPNPILAIGAVGLLGALSGATIGFVGGRKIYRK